MSRSRPSSRWQLITNAVRARLGGIDAADTDAALVRASRLWSTPTIRLLEIALDGEPTDLRVPLRFRSRPGALHVLAAPTQRPATIETTPVA